MNSPAHDIALYLAAASVGTFAVDLFVGNEPAQPDNCVTVYDYPGGEHDTDQMDIERPNFQVRVRALKYDEGYARQEQIANLLIQSATGIVCETSRFPLVMPITNIAGLGRDSNQRNILVASYRAIRTKEV